MDQTKCTEEDLGCRFSLLIFFEKKQEPHREVQRRRPHHGEGGRVHGGKGGSTHFFGMGYSCLH